MEDDEASSKNDPQGAAMKDRMRKERSRCSLLKSVLGETPGKRKVGDEEIKRSKISLAPGEENGGKTQRQDWTTS